MIFWSIAPLGRNIVFYANLGNITATPTLCEEGEMPIWDASNQILGAYHFQEWVAVDPEKISAMVDWPLPKNPQEPTSNERVPRVNRILPQIH